jgi:hypothetical protein
MCQCNKIKCKINFSDKNVKTKVVHILLWSNTLFYDKIGYKIFLVNIFCNYFALLTGGSLAGAMVAHWREQWWLIVGSSGGSLVAHWWEQWWLIGGSSSGSLVGAVVAHCWEQWWLIGGSSGGSLVATPDCEILGSNPAISPAYSGLPVLRWAAIWGGTSL